MLLLLLILALLSVTFIFATRSGDVVHGVAQLFFISAMSFALTFMFHIGDTAFWFFTYDTLGVTYFAMMSLLGTLCAWRSKRYLNTETLRDLKIYYTSLIGLSIALTGVYLSNNVTVTWIFMEATTIATAGLTYHRRTIRSLEATWKYIFVSSVGIAIAYLGILLLSTVSQGHAEVNFSYDALANLVAQGNTLYIKLAFLFILVGYSTKMELFPLFTVGVDANHAAPSPAAAFISTAMVGGGFVAVFRVFKLIEHHAQAFAWVQNVMLIVGVASLLIAVVYMGRTTNYKRLFAYSTVENSGIIALGLGIGGLGVYAAVLHSIAHTLIKGVVFLQLSVVGKMYNNYKVGRMGDYFRVDKSGALVMILGLVGLMAMPPSLLFKSELLILSQIVSSGGTWWLILPVCVAILGVVYWLCSKVIPLLYRPCDHSKIMLEARDTLFSSVILVVLLAVFVCGMWSMPWLDNLINSIVQ